MFKWKKTCISTYEQYYYFIFNSYNNFAIDMFSSLGNWFLESRFLVIILFQTIGKDNNNHFHFLWERFKYHPKTFGGWGGVTTKVICYIFSIVMDFNWKMVSEMYHWGFERDGCGPMEPFMDLWFLISI